MRMSAWVSPCGFVLCAAFASGSSLTQGVTAESFALPRLTFDAVPSPVRAGLQAAYDAASARPRDPSALGRLAMILHAYEQHGPAAICYRAASTLAPRSLSWAYLSAVVEAELGENKAAAAAFRRALAIDPGYWPARLRLAAALMDGGDLEASQHEYDALVRDFPELAVAHYDLGRLLWSRGDAVAAVKRYQRAVELEPAFGRAHYALALAYRDAGAADRGETHLDAYRRLGPRRPAPPDRLLDQIRAMRGTGRDLLAEGARLGRAGRLADAIALHLKAVDADPADAQPHVNLISLYGRTGQPDSAEKHYRAALALGSSLAEAHYNYGVLLAAASRYDEAAAAFRKALEVNAFYASAHHNLAALLARQGRLSDAAGHYERAIANDPQHRGARAGLGRVLVALGRPREAIDQLRRVLEPEDAETPRYRYALANAYLAAGDAAQAREHGRQALGRATDLGQTDLAASIAQWLRRIPAGQP